jgi:hypothetical protein
MPVESSKLLPSSPSELTLPPSKNFFLERYYIPRRISLIEIQVYKPMGLIEATCHKVRLQQHTEALVVYDWNMWTEVKYPLAQLVK